MHATQCLPSQQRTTAQGATSRADREQRATIAASDARSNTSPGLCRSVAKPHSVLLTLCRLASRMRAAACAAHAASSAPPGWWPIAAKPCTMLDVQRADSSPARDAAQPNVGLSKPYTCPCNTTLRHANHGARCAQADSSPARNAVQPGVRFSPCNVTLRHANHGARCAQVSSLPALNLPQPGVGVSLNNIGRRYANHGALCSGPCIPCHQIHCRCAAHKKRHMRAGSPTSTAADAHGPEQGWSALMAVFRRVNAGCTAACIIAPGAACCLAMRLTAVARFTALNSGKSLSTTAKTSSKHLGFE